MELEQGKRTSRSTRTLLVWFIVATFVDLGLLIIILFIRALTSSGGFLAPIYFLGEAFFALTFASLALGLAHAWRSYSQHRQAIIFIAGITLATLLAHAYIIGMPPASESRTPVAGNIGSQLTSSDKGDGGSPLLSVDSSLVGDRLTVTVSASGSSAIVNLDVSAGSNLSGVGFTQPPTFASPLKPGSSVIGTWTVAGQPSSLTVGYQSLNCYKSSYPGEYGCIMDEVFYVPEGMAVFQGQACTAGNGAPTNCHLEHPPLVPMLIASGMAIFGEYNVAGWRLMSVLLGSLSIPLLFGIAWKVSGSKRTAYVASILLSLDVMFFSQSSAALLDVPEIFFGLAAFFAYFAELRVWKFDKHVIAAVLLGVAGLAKETAVFMALALLTYILVFGEGRRLKRARTVILMAVIIGLVFSAGLEAYDSTMTTSPSPGGTGCQLTSTTFIGQIDYILCYGSGLTAEHLSCVTAGYWCRFPSDPKGTPILPLDWVTFYSPVEYYATTVSVCPNSVNGTCRGGAYSYVSLAYYGVTNFLETWTVFIWIPLVAYALYRQFRRDQPSLEEFGFESPGSQTSRFPAQLRLAAFALILFFWTYVPYLLLFGIGRVTYPFYFLPAVPAVALGCTYWLTREWFPKRLMAIYLAMVFVFFFVYFPEKAFLPDWLRVFIGH